MLFTFAPAGMLPNALLTALWKTVMTGSTHFSFGLSSNDESVEAVLDIRLFPFSSA
ncbi:MAG: hypothetical protein R2849_19605 [Thermomicrobiales bacterium]